MDTNRTRKDPRAWADKIDGRRAEIGAFFFFDSRIDFYANRFPLLNYRRLWPRRRDIGRVARRAG